MRTITTMAVVLMGLSGVACVPGNSPIRVTGTFPDDPGKTGCAPADIGQLSGSLDLSGDGTYYTWVKIDNETQEIVVKNNAGENLSQVGQNNFIIDNLLLTYVSTPKIQFENETLALSGVIKPASKDNAYFFNIVGPKALEKLRGSWSEDTTLQVTFSMRGHLEGGQTVQSNPYTYPITVTNNTPAAPSCDSPKFLAPFGPCSNGGGQDGTAIVCCSALTDPGCTVTP